MKNQQKKGDRRKNFYERKKCLDSIKVLMKKNPAKAKAELIRELDENPDDMYCWFYYGQICQAQSSLDEAEYAYTKVADSTSRNKYAGVVGLADIARIKGNLNKARRLYRKAITENPGENRTTYYILARLECGDGNVEEALRLLNQLDPNCNDTKLEKARVYIDSGDIENAQAIIESVVPENELEKRTLAYAKAKICVQQEDYTAATYHFLEARECKVKDAQYYKILTDEAKLAIETRNYQLAIDNCEEALAANENAYGDNYLTLGLAKQGLGQYQSAMNCFKVAIAENTVSYAPKTACSYFLARLQMLMGEIEEAEITLKSSIIPDLPPRPSVVDLLLNIYIKQARYKEASELISLVKNTYKDSNDKASLRFSETIIASRTGKISQKERLRSVSYASYRERQAIEYSKADAIEHIISHHQLGAFSDGSFPKNKNIEKLYDEVREQLTDDNRTVLDVADRYFIDYPNAGYTPTGEIVHRIGVVTLPGTKDILTMYPDIDTTSSRMTVKDIKQACNPQNTGPTNRISRFNSRFANFTPPKN